MTSRRFDYLNLQGIVASGSSLGELGYTEDVFKPVPNIENPVDAASKQAKNEEEPDRSCVCRCVEEGTSWMS